MPPYEAEAKGINRGNPQPLLNWKFHSISGSQIQGDMILLETTADAATLLRGYRDGARHCGQVTKFLEFLFTPKTEYMPNIYVDV